MNDPIGRPIKAGFRDNDGLHKRRGMWHYKLKIAGKWREYTAKTRNYQEARDVYRKALESQEKGLLPADRGKQTFVKAAEVWKETRKLEKKAENTLRVERERLKPLLAFFGETKLKEISAAHVKEYRLQRGKVVGPRTINLEIKVLRMMLTDSRCWARLNAELSEAGYKPLPENRRGPGVALTEEQLRKLIESASSKPDWDAAYLAAWIAANTAMRGVELRKLRHRNVDLFAHEVRIEREGTKTDAGARIVSLNDEAVRVFGRLIERAQRLGSVEPDHFLFPFYASRQKSAPGVERGIGYDPTRPAKGWRTAWRSLRTKAGLPKLRFHDLRHTVISQLAEKGVPIEVTMDLVGHISPEMTRHYTHISAKAKAAAVTNLGVFRAPATDTSQVPTKRPS
jgi:integrase